MTSAQTFTGIGDRSSSRVLAAPGGAQSFSIFGGGNEAPTHTITGRKIRQPEPVQSNQENRPGAYEHNRPSQQQQSHQSPYGQQQQRSYQEPIKQQQQQQNPQFSASNQPQQSNGGAGLHEGRSSTRVHAPPGGQSSMGSILGGGSSQQEPTNYGHGRRDPNASSQQQSSAPSQQQPRSSGNIISWQ